MACSKGRLMTGVGILMIFIGLAVTMYGNLHKPYWSVYCGSFCREEWESSSRTTRNCRIVGPVFIGMGVLFFIIGLVSRRKERIINIGKGGLTVSAYPTTTTTTGIPVQPAMGTHPPMGPYPFPQKPGAHNTAQQDIPPYPPPQDVVYPSDPLHGGYPRQQIYLQHGYPQQEANQPPAYPGQQAAGPEGFAPPPYQETTPLYDPNTTRYVATAPPQ